MVREGKNSNLSVANRRFFAWLIDIIAYLIVVFITGAVTYAKVMSGGFGMRMFGAFSNLTIIALILPFVYIILMHSLFGATLGMIITRLKIRSTVTGDKPNIIAVIIHTFFWIVSFESLLIGFFWMLGDSRKQTFAEKLSKTVILPTSELYDAVRPSSFDDKKRWKVGKVIAIFFTIVFLFLIGFWAYQPPLNSDAVAYLGDYNIEENPQENGFYDLVAFFADEGVDTNSEGVHRIQEANKMSLALNKTNVLESIELVAPIRAVLNDSLAQDISEISQITGTDDYLEYIKTNKEMIKNLFVKYNYLENRYDNILNYKRIDNKVLPLIYSVQPHWVSLVVYQRLYTANYIREFMFGDRTKAVEMMKQSDKVTQYFFINADNLFMKLVSNILIGVNQVGIIELLDYEKMIDYRLYKYVMDRKKLTHEELSLREVNNNEFTYRINGGLSEFVRADFLNDGILTPKELIKYSKPFARMNYLANTLWVYHQFQSEYSEMTPVEIFEKAEVEYEITFNKVELMRNWLGWIDTFRMTQLSTGYKKYAIRNVDTNTMYDLVKVKAEIRKRGLKGESIQKFLDANVETYYCPYNGESFKWNAELNSISFDGPYPDGEFVVRTVKL